jgi:hypothetical protein
VGAALYVVLEDPNAGIDAAVDGKALSRAEGDLAVIANDAGVRQLMGFFSMSSEEFAAEIEQFNALAGAPEASPPEEEWFTAAEGLATVRALLAYLRAHPETVRRSVDVLADLESFERVLEEAEQRGIRWHLCVDY